MNKLGGRHKQSGLIGIKLGDMRESVGGEGGLEVSHSPQWVSEWSLDLRLGSSRSWDLY